MVVTIRHAVWVSFYGGVSLCTQVCVGLACLNLFSLFPTYFNFFCCGNVVAVGDTGLHNLKVGPHSLFTWCVEHGVCGGFVCTGCFGYFIWF